MKKLLTYVLVVGVLLGLVAVVLGESHIYNQRLDAAATTQAVAVSKLAADSARIDAQSARITDQRARINADSAHITKLQSALKKALAVPVAAPLPTCTGIWWGINSIIAATGGVPAWSEPEGGPPELVPPEQVYPCSLTARPTVWPYPDYVHTGNWP